MNKDKYIELLKNAETDKYGNLYIREDDRKWYFSLTNTVCEDLIDIITDYGDLPNKHEIYDRHWVNDDTLQSKIVFAGDYNVKD